jgi:hypothetical protein
MNANGNNNQNRPADQNRNIPNTFNNSGTNNGFYLYPVDQGVRPAMPGAVNPQSNIIQFQASEYTNDKLYPKID